MKKLTMTRFSGGGGQLDKKGLATQGVPEAQHYNASLSETRRDSQAIIRHAELVSASNHSQAEERLCHRAFAHLRTDKSKTDTRSKKVIADSSFRTSAMTDFSQDVQRSKAAFTLAEVLITLGIIGVVAALTLPTLLANYKKNVTVTRLKHFSSLIQQVTQMRNAATMNSITPELPELEGYNPELMLQYFNVYYKPYLKFSDVEKLQKGVLVSLDNGSAFYLIRTGVCATSPWWSCNTYIMFCPEYKYCKNINENGSPHNVAGETMHDGKHIFAFYTTGRVPTGTTWTRETVLEAINNGRTFFCGTLIEMDGWEIADDNPCLK